MFFYLVDYLSLKQANFPKQCNIEIEHEYLFDCDRRLWQLKIFDTFIYKKLQRTEHLYIDIGQIEDWLKLKPNGELVYWKLVYLISKVNGKRDFSDYEYPTLAQAIAEYFEALCKLGYLQNRNKSENENPYYWRYKVLKDTLK